MGYFEIKPKNACDPNALNQNIQTWNSSYYSPYWIQTLDLNNLNASIQHSNVTVELKDRIALAICIYWSINKLTLDAITNWQFNKKYAHYCAFRFSLDIIFTRTMAVYMECNALYTEIQYSCVWVYRDSAMMLLLLLLLFVAVIASLPVPLCKQQNYLDRTRWVCLLPKTTVEIHKTNIIYTRTPPPPLPPLYIYAVCIRCERTHLIIKDYNIYTRTTANIW